MPDRSTDLDSVYDYGGSLVSLGSNIIVSSFSGPSTATLEFDDADDDFTYEPTEAATFNGETVTATAAGTVVVGINLGVLRINLDEPVPVNVIETTGGTYVEYPESQPSELLDGLVTEILNTPLIGPVLSSLGITDVAAYVEQNALLTFTLDQDIAIPVCFRSGTLILTKYGQRRVEDLQVGDEVITRDNGFQPIRWIDCTRVEAKGAFAPIEFLPGTIGNDEALFLSPEHRVLMTGWAPELLTGEPEVFVAAKHLVNDGNIRICPGGHVTYVHFMLDRHEIVFANGAQCESFHPGDVGLRAMDRDARSELFALFPHLAEMNLLATRKTARFDTKRAVGAAIGRLSMGGAVNTTEFRVER
ncbi:hypothetical protein LA6_005269 [Marinibacterium anthonyi]|nr:hypothetical protein LA6_005269 [Marinibacterium anthonyi]